MAGEIYQINTAERWSHSLRADEYLKARYIDWNVGEWVQGSVHSHLRISELDFSLQKVKKAYRSYLYSGLVACFALDRLLKEYLPEVLFIFNGRLASTRIAVELAKGMNIRVLPHDRGQLKASGFMKAAVCSPWNR
ncbi:MAG: hypothetical protein HQ542_02795 [Bacteroidia bacterium]|nr:hypothetical protein [Bacteroidia bacterium]